MSYDPTALTNVNFIFSAYNSAAQNNSSSATDVVLDVGNNITIQADNLTVELPDNCILIGDTRSHYPQNERGHAYLDYTATGLDHNMRSQEFTGYAIGGYGRAHGPQILYGINRAGATTTKVRQVNTSSSVIFNEEINHSRLLGFIV